MQVRIPKFDFTGFKPHWASSPEFSQLINAGSILPAHIEPYLCKVMLRARKELDPVQHADLIRDIDIFIRQENQHCKQHIAYNKALYENGYECMLPVEAEYKADYQHFLERKSLRFNLAYSEGFESLGSGMATPWFCKNMAAQLEGADTAVANLWKWHVAEEFDHRTVCHQVYKALCCKGWWRKIVFGYFYRVWAFVYAVRHLEHYRMRCAELMIAKDRETMDEAARKQSEAREREAKRFIVSNFLPPLWKVFSPFYNPATIPAPPGVEEFFEQNTQPVA